MVTGFYYSCILRFSIGIKVILNLVATEEVGINDVDILNDCFIGFANRLIIAVSFWLKVDYVI